MYLSAQSSVYFHLRHNLFNTVKLATSVTRILHFISYYGLGLKRIIFRPANGSIRGSVIIVLGGDGGGGVTYCVCVCECELQQLWCTGGATLRIACVLVSFRNQWKTYTSVLWNRCIESRYCLFCPKNLRRKSKKMLRK